MKAAEATGLRIREICKERNITINKLTNISGVTQSTVNDLVNGNPPKSPTVTTQKNYVMGLK